MIPTLFLFTDFGAGSLYVGQLHSLIATHAPDIRVIDLCHELHPFQPRPASYLLSALCPYLSTPSVLVGIVDPGVGTTRLPILVRCSNKLDLIGPDNGLFALAMRQFSGKAFQLRKLDAHPLSRSFHGRDLFVPWAIHILKNTASALEVEPVPCNEPIVGSDWPSQIQEVIHIDRFGNAMTGCSGAGIEQDRVLLIKSHTLPFRSTFGDAMLDEPFWYVNSLQLIEISCNRVSAKDALDIQIGDTFIWV